MRNGEWRVKTNRHPNTDGTLWGWVEEAVYIGPNPFCHWSNREIRTWSGEADMMRAHDECREHNAGLEDK